MTTLDDRSGCVVRVPVIERKPVRIRVPVTLDSLAELMAKDFTCDRRDCNCKIPLANHFWQALYDSIIALVYNLAKKYAITCNDNVPDLAQDCLAKIFRKLPQYERSRGKFTTWIWHVCSNELRRKYRKTKKRRRVWITPDDPDDFDMAVDRPPVSLASEIAQVVNFLLDHHPDQRDVLLEFFGDPLEEDYAPPPRVKIAATARALDKSYGEVSRFYHQVVRPVFREWFDVKEREDHG